MNVHTPASATRTGPWIQTASGRAWFLLDPRPEDVWWPDIIEGQAKCCRFAGQMPGKFFSTGEHACNVADSLRPKGRVAQLYGILHDAKESLLGDWTTPLKQAVRMISPAGADALASIEDRTDAAIHARAGLPWPPHPDIVAAVKTADMAALRAERRDLMARKPMPWGDEVERGRALPVRVQGLAWPQAAVRFETQLRDLLPASAWWPA